MKNVDLGIIFDDEQFLEEWGHVIGHKIKTELEYLNIDSGQGYVKKPWQHKETYERGILITGYNSHQSRLYFVEPEEWRNYEKNGG